MIDRQNILFIGIIMVVAIAAVIFAVVWTNAHDGQPKFISTTTSAITASDHTLGSATSTVSLIEYGDFECPACGAYEPMVEQLRKAYAGKVLFVFRNFPLTRVHPNAMIGAEAAEAAALQGKYWQMHDMLFAKQKDWSLGNAANAKTMIDSYARSLGLNVTTFNRDMQSSAVANKIKADIAAGNAASVNHTPTFFINLKQIPNPQSYAEFTSELNNALSSAS